MWHDNDYLVLTLFRVLLSQIALQPSEDRKKYNRREYLLSIAKMNLL